MAAETASITPADRIAYHVPMPPDLHAETGRLGFELGRVRKILDGATPRSLTVLDDCLDGTTHEERVQILKNVMLGFRHLGGATLFSTHAHELVGDFESRDEGQFLQVEFQDDAPTYRIVPGVSHTSHAASVAREHGFTEEQIKAEIESQGISI
jgi:DNA mismatch repair ATPase MutS